MSPRSTAQSIQNYVIGLRNTYIWQEVQALRIPGTPSGFWTREMHVARWNYNTLTQFILILKSKKKCLNYSIEGGLLHPWRWSNQLIQMSVFVVNSKCCYEFGLEFECTKLNNCRWNKFSAVLLFLAHYSIIALFTTFFHNYLGWASHLEFQQINPLVEQWY